MADTTSFDGHVAVLGAGTIGASWVALFIAHGLDVMVWDPDAAASARIEAGLPRQLQAVKRLMGDSPPVGRWWTADSAPAAVRGAGFVQESGSEDLLAKRRLFNAIAPDLGPAAIVASSTSTIMPSDLQHGLPYAERLVVGHPVNPPHLIPLVEVVGGRNTAEATVDQTMGFYRALGKYPIRLRSERPGHLINRIQAALWREAVDAVASGAASVADVDAVLTQALGLRWALLGPHATLHLGGGPGGLGHFMDHLGPAFVALWHDMRLPELSSEVRAKLIAGVQEELGGRDIAEVIAWREERLMDWLVARPPSLGTAG